MIDGGIFRSILFFSIPLLIGNFFQQLYNTVDSYVVGNFVNTNALAAVGASFSLMNFITAILIGICTTLGVSPAIPTMLLAFIVAGNFLLPVNPTLIVTYGEGYYTFGDMFKAGVIPAVIFCVCMVLWVPFICGVLGL